MGLELCWTIGARTFGEAYYSCSISNLSYFVNLEVTPQNASYFVLVAWDLVFGRRTLPYMCLIFG